MIVIRAFTAWYLTGFSQLRILNLVHKTAVFGFTQTMYVGKEQGVGHELEIGFLSGSINTIITFSISLVEATASNLVTYNFQCNPIIRT